GDGFALAVDDPSTPRRYRDQLDPVALREELVFFVLRNREPAHAPDQHRADSGLGAAEQEHPARERDRLMRGGDPHRLAHRPSLHLSIRKTTQALIGKTQIEMTSGGSIFKNRTSAFAAAASRHCSHSSIASNTAAKTHSIQ